MDDGASSVTRPPVMLQTVSGPPGTRLGAWLAGPVHRRSGLPAVVRPFDRVVVTASAEPEELPVNAATPEAVAARQRRLGAELSWREPLPLADVAALVSLCEARGRGSVELVRADPTLLPELQVGAWSEAGWRTRWIRRISFARALSSRQTRLFDRLPATVIGVVADLAFWRGVASVATTAEWRLLTSSYVVLSYHRISDDDKPDQELLEVSTCAFRAQMRLLRWLRFRPLSIEDLRKIHTATTAPPPRGFVVTADDGFDDCTEPLAAAGVGAQLFVPTAEVGTIADVAWARAHPSPGWMVDGEPLATWDRLRAIERRGVGVGSHGRRHVALTELAPAELARELAGAVAELSAEMTRPIPAIAYPHGLHDRTVRDAAIDAGHVLGYTTQFGRNGAGTDAFCLRRVPIHRDDRLGAFLWKVVTGEPRSRRTRQVLASRGAVARRLQNVRGKLGAVVRLVRRPSLDNLRETARGRRIVARVSGFRAGDVLEVLDALDGAGVRVWLAGGWGVDALLGEETRPHGDLDLVVASEDDNEESVIATLGALGYARAATSTTPGVLIERRWVFQSPRRRSVDVLPVDTRVPPFAEGAFVTGDIAGRTVPCVSAAVQRAARSGYEPRAEDAHDLEALRTLRDP
ncbi:MAG: hypothetical protein QOI47_1131 [Actinomycetota bacterium]|nr:hypothetical protein [Actinomycetota bacterium]